MVEPVAPMPPTTPDRDDVEAQGESEQRPLVDVAIPEQSSIKPRVWPPAWACRGARARTFATVLLSFTALGFFAIFFSVLMVLSPLLGSLRTMPPQDKQEAIARRAILVGGDLPRSGASGEKPTPVRVQIKKLPHQTMDVYTQVCMGIDVHNAADEWMAAAKHHPTAVWAALADPQPVRQVHKSLSLAADRWAGSLMHAALRRVHAAQVQLGPTRVSQAPAWRPSPLPEFKLDPIMDSVCPATTATEPEVGIQKAISDAVQTALGPPAAGMFDITFDPVLVPLRPIEEVAPCGTLPSHMGDGNITLYPVQIKAHVVPLSEGEGEAVEENTVHGQPYIFSGYEQRVMADVHVQNVSFAALSRTEAGEAMQQWPSLPDVPQGSLGRLFKRVGHLSTWAHGTHGAVDFRVSAPMMRALRCLSGIEGPNEGSGSGGDDPSSGWWDRWGKQVQVQLSSAAVNPLTSELSGASLAEGGLAWKVGVQVTSALFAPFEIDWPFTVPVEVGLPLPSADMAGNASQTLAKVELLPFSLSNGSTLITLQGEVNRLPDIEVPGSADLLDTFLAGLLQGKASPILIRGGDACAEPEEGMRAPYWLCSLWRKFEYEVDLAPLAALIPRPGTPHSGAGLDLPDFVQNLAFHNVSLRPHPFGPHKLTVTADLTAEVHLPAELDPVDIQLHAIWPDMILVSLPPEEEDARVERTPYPLQPHLARPADLASPTLFDDPTTWVDVPSEPAFRFPDPLPVGAFAHTRLPMWAATSLTWLPYEGQSQETVRVLHAKFIDAPLDALPGQNAELRKFIWSVSRGDVNVQALGEVGVRASVPALGPHITTLLAVPVVTNVTVDRA